MAEADPFASATPEQGTAHPDETQSSSKRDRWRLPLLVVVPLIVVTTVLWWWFSSPDIVKTDNSYVKQAIVAVGGEVQGLVVSVNVRENQVVRAGDVLFTIDPAPYQVALEQANAQIAQAQAGVISMQAEVTASAAEVSAARDDLRLAESNLSRQKALMVRGFNTRANMDTAEHAVAVARDRVAAVQADIAKQQAKLATGAAVPGVNPALAVARAGRDKATLQLKRTVVRAPADGTVTQANRLQIGQMVFPGVPMISLVRSDGTRIDANFKETDLTHMRVGQPAEIKLDAYPDLKLKGHVASIGVGTGSEFSVLPAQNATGNWVKITQRVPVRIAIDTKLDRPLIAGLSAVVKVDVGKH